MGVRIWRSAWWRLVQDRLARLHVEAGPAFVEVERTPARAVLLQDPEPLLLGSALEHALPELPSQLPGGAVARHTPEHGDDPTRQTRPSGDCRADKRLVHMHILNRQPISRNDAEREEHFAPAFARRFLSCVKELLLE